MKLATCVIALAAIGFGIAPAADDDAVRKDMAGLQGEWSMVSGSADGQPVPDDMRKQMKRVCQGDEATTTMAGQIFMKAKITLDPAKNPKTIDYEMTGGFSKGKTQLGIYELEGDRFKACFAGPGAGRPADFTSTPGDGRTLSVWKREKAAAPRTQSTAVSVEYIAHACFRVTSPSGKKILLDPYASRIWLGYDFPPNLDADAVLISHPHYDHDGGEAKGRKVPWPPTALVLRHPGTNQIGDITVLGYAGKHADPWGKEFGQINTIWLLEVGALRIVHLGDNGPLRDDTLRQLGRVDVLMMPIDSQFHILKADEIATIRRQLSPSVLVPMHYRHDDLEPAPDRPEALGGIEGWAKGGTNVRYLDTHTNSFSVDTLSRQPEVIIFKHSPLVRPPQ